MRFENRDTEVFMYLVKTFVADKDKYLLPANEYFKASMEKVRPMYEMFKGWAEEFMQASIEQKKMIISQIISRIEIGKGYKLNIILNMEYEQFCKGWNGLNNI